MAKPVRSRAIFAGIAVLIGFILSYLLISQYDFQPAGNQPLDASVGNIGTQLMSTGEHGYALPFEAVSILLLAAMIGCIVIAMKADKKQETRNKAQDNTRENVQDTRDKNEENERIINA